MFPGFGCPRCETHSGGASLIGRLNAIQGGLVELADKRVGLLGEYPLLGFGWSPLRSLIAKDWKYIDAPKPELFDRKTDPAELVNVIDDHIDVAKRMQEDLAGLMSQMTKRVASSVALDEKALDQLAGLGYVAGAAASVDVNDGTARKDPKDMIEVYTGFERATAMLRAHDHEGVIRLLEPLIERSPESDVVHGLLAMAYLNAQRFADAQRAFEASLRTTPHQSGRLCGLAEAFRKQGKFQDAIDAYERALDASPNWTAAHSGLGALYSRMKRYAQAEPHWRRCVELDPASVNALTNLGTVLLAQRRPAEAIPLLQQALGYDPANEFAHRSLWQALAGVGQRAGAIQALRNARKALPGAASLACPLARLLATTPRMPRRGCRRILPGDASPLLGGGLRLRSRARHSHPNRRPRKRCPAA